MLAVAGREQCESGDELGGTEDLLQLMVERLITSLFGVETVTLLSTPLGLLLTLRFV